jgi:hypothetical protein
MYEKMAMYVMQVVFYYFIYFFFFLTKYVLQCLGSYFYINIFFNFIKHEHIRDFLIHKKCDLRVLLNMK